MTSVRRIDRRMATVARGDFLGSTGRPTPEQVSAVMDPGTGWLILEGRVSRGDCVLEYNDGVETWGELRRVEDVYDDAACASMLPRPIVDSKHPWANSENYSEISRGSTGPVRIEDGWCIQLLAIQKKDMVDAVLAGEAIELSTGYECVLVPDEGELDGIPYKFRQTNIRVNHQAIGPRDWARAGNEACLIFDAGNATRSRVGVQVIGDSKVTNTNKNKKSKDAAKGASAKAKDGKYMIGEVEYELDDAVIAYIESLKAKPEGDAEDEPMVDAEEPAAEAPPKTDKVDKRAADKAQATADAFERYKASELVRFDARAKLMLTAREVLGAHANVDGLAAVEIQKQVITRLLGKSAPDLKGKSPDYIAATFDHAVEQSRDAGSFTRAIGFGQVHGHVDSGGEKRQTLDDARNTMLARMSGNRKEGT